MEEEAPGIKFRDLNLISGEPSSTTLEESMGGRGLSMRGRCSSVGKGVHLPSHMGGWAPSASTHLAKTFGPALCKSSGGVPRRKD